MQLKLAEKIYIENLTAAQKEKVFANNEKLQNLVIEDMIESEMHWISEHFREMENANLNYEYGGYSPTWIKVDENKLHDFYDGLQRVHMSYCVLPEKKGNRLIEELGRAIDRMDQAETNSYFSGYDEKYDRAKERAAKKAQQIADEMAAYYTKAIFSAYKEKNQLLYFLEFYSTDSRMNEEEYYILDGDENYKLHRLVSYVQTF